MADAPPLRYSFAMGSGEKSSRAYSGRIHPAEGLLRLISAITAVRPALAMVRRAPKKLRGGSAWATRASISRIETPALARSTSSRLFSTISRSVAGISLGPVAMGVIVALTLALVVPDAAAQGEAARSFESKSVRDVLSDVDRWKLPLLGVSSLLVLALLAAGGLLRPGGFEKAGIRDISPIPWTIWVFAALIVFLAMYSAAGVLEATGAYDWIGAENGLSDDRKMIITALGASALGAITGLGMLFVLHKSAPEGGLRVSFVDAPLGLGCFLLAFPIVQLAAIGAFALYKSVATDGQAPDPIAHDILRSVRDQFQTGTQDVWTWLLIANAVIGAPIVEELIYRVFLQSAFLRLFKSPWVSIIVTALVFALMHRASTTPVPWHALIPLLALGIAMGVAYERTRRVGVPITMHMCFNALNLAYVILSADGYDIPAAPAQ